MTEHRPPAAREREYLTSWNRAPFPVPGPRDGVGNALRAAFKSEIAADRDFDRLLALMP